MISLLPFNMDLISDKIKGFLQLHILNYIETLF